MNTKNLTLAFLLLLTVALPLGAVIDGFDAVPAATLLHPYFEIAYAAGNANRTVLTIGNSADTETLVHVTLWTDLGVPAFAFDLRIDARGTKEIDLLALFRDGTLPQSTAGGFPACGGVLPPANLGAAARDQLRRAFRGQSSILLGGDCGGVDHGQSIARGYVTLDVTSDCTVLFPSGSGYFVAGGNGIATNDNVIWGEVYTSAGDQAAHGTPLVHIEASSTDPVTDGAPGPAVECPVVPCPPNPPAFVQDYTFYSRVIGSAADNREGLPQQWLGRYDVAGQVTLARIWRDPGSVAPFACGALPAGIGLREITSFDEIENPFLGPDRSAPLATQEIEIDASTFLPPDLDRGFLHYNLTLPSPSGAFGTRNQSYVSHVYDRGLVRSEAAAGSNFPISSPIVDNLPIGPPVDPPCSDGIDNDGDGLVDHPADPGCGAASSFIENPACDDGFDNDFDGATDLADSDCHSARDHFEQPGPGPQCDDGIDNDGDGAIDWVADGGCFGFPPWLDNSEDSNTCNDGFDNDGDGLVDFPADPGCGSPSSAIENPVCNDGISNDADGLVDFPADPGCSSAASGNEAPQCDDGISNDADGLVDFPADPGCASRSSNLENPQCDNGVNDDAPTDFLIDLADPGCTSPTDPFELELECSDGLDNNSDGFTDFPNDASCIAPDDDSEALASCSDLLDNDCDGLTDALDPGCENPDDPTETPGPLPQCADLVDNDLDGRADFPNDEGCISRADDIEFDVLEGPVLDVPTLSTWGLILMALLIAVVAAVALRAAAPTG
jgi:hypothetical protein